MKGSDIFPSKYIKADDLQGRDVNVTISNVEMQRLGDENKLVVYFKGKDKGMVFNRTNFDRVSFMYGDETDDWVGKPVTITTEFAQFNGKTGPALRIKPPTTQGRPAPRVQTMTENPADGMSDEIPF